MAHLLPPRHTTRGFTLIELLVVLAIVTLLVSLLLPALGSARENGRMIRCASNLRQLGIGFLAYSNNNRGFYCSGPFDNSTEEGRGPIHEVGWVADMVNGQYAIPGHLLCPSSPARISQTLAPRRLNSRAFQTFTPTEVEHLVDQGFNTNYCQSWYMANTEMKSPLMSSGLQPKRASDTLGPLNERHLGAAASPSMVPLMGDGTTVFGDEDDRVPFRGQLLYGAKTLTDGPYGARLPGFSGTVFGRQNYTDLGPAHGKAGFAAAVGHDRIYGHILFADGHVEAFRDTVRDGLWGASQQASGSIVNFQYHELEGKVFGGWLVRPGLAH